MRKQQIYTNFINNGHFEMNIYFIKKKCQNIKCVFKKDILSKQTQDKEAVQIIILQSH